jgi:DnaK suppressor protein
MEVEELTDTEEHELEADLTALQAELEVYLQSSRGGAAPVDLDEPIGRISRMDAIQQQSMARATRTRNEARLRQVLAAQSWLRQGEYGSCRKCDDPIGYRRLKARPETPFCVDCQSAFERG